MRPRISFVAKLVVESLEKKRQPFHDLEAIYILTPTPESIDILISDFSSRGKPPYAGAHIYFNASLPDTLFQRIQRSPLQRYVLSLKELNMDFIGNCSYTFC
jgi:syntaxin-binding protein 1